MADPKNPKPPRVSQPQMNKHRRDQKNAVQDLGYVDGDGEWPGVAQNRRVSQWDWRQGKQAQTRNSPGWGNFNVDPVRVGPPGGYNGGVMFNPNAKLDPSQVEYAPGFFQGGVPAPTRPPGYSPYTGQNEDNWSSVPEDGSSQPFYLLHPDGTHSGPHYDPPRVPQSQLNRPRRDQKNAVQDLGRIEGDAEWAATEQNRRLRADDVYVETGMARQPDKYPGQPRVFPQAGVPAPKSPGKMGLAAPPRADKPKPVVAHQTMKPDPKPVTKAPPKVKQPAAPRSGPNRQA